MHRMPTAVLEPCSSTYCLGIDGHAVSKKIGRLSDESPLRCTEGITWQYDLPDHIPADLTGQSPPGDDEKQAGPVTDGHDKTTQDIAHEVWLMRHFFIRTERSPKW